MILYAFTRIKYADDGGKVCYLEPGDKVTKGLFSDDDLKSYIENGTLVKYNRLGDSEEEEVKPQPQPEVKPKPKPKPDPE